MVKDDIEEVDDAIFNLRKEQEEVERALNQTDKQDKQDKPGEPAARSEEKKTGPDKEDQKISESNKQDRQLFKALFLKTLQTKTEELKFDL